MKDPKNHPYLSKMLRLFLILSLLAVYLQFPQPALAYNGDYALEFDGVSDFVQLDTSVNILGANWQSTKTISVWVRPTSVAPDVTVVPQVINGNMIVGDHPRWFGIYQANVTSTGEDRIWVCNADNIDTVGNAFIGIPYTIGEWVHITLVHDNNVLYAYKNGILIGSQPSGRTAYGHLNVDTIELRIGGRDTGQLFQGQIDEVRMWSTALTTNEIRRDMYRTLAGDESGLAAYYQMSDGAGTTLTDNSTNNHDGTLVDGSTTISPDGDTAAWVTSGAFAGPRNALDFDGTDEFVSVPNTIAMPSNLTLEAWVYPRDASGPNWIVGEVGGAQLTMDGDTAQFSIYDGGLQGPATATLVLNQWQHLAGTYDGSNLRIFVNGLEGTAAAFSGSNADQGGIFAIGGDGVSQYNNSLIDEVHLWDTALTPTQIRENMFQTLQGSESNLVAYYRFDQDADASGSTTLYDLTANGNHGTLTNMEAASDWVASTPFNTWIGGDTSAWSEGGNWSRYAAPGTTDNAGIYNYPASNAPEITSSVETQHLIVTSGAALAVENGGTLNVIDSDRFFVNPGGSLTVNSGGTLNIEGAGSGILINGNITNNGVFQHTQNVNNESKSFLELSDDNGTPQYRGAELTTANTLGDVTVRISAVDGTTSYCTTDAGSSPVYANRCFEITADTSAAANLRLWALSSEFDGSITTPSVYRYNGGTWNELTDNAGFGTNGSYTYAEADTPGFSHFLIAQSGNAPSALSLTSFSGSTTNANLLPALALLLLAGFLLGFYLRKKLKSTQAPVRIQE